MAAPHFGQPIVRPIRNFAGYCAKNTTLRRYENQILFSSLVTKMPREDYDRVKPLWKEAMRVRGRLIVTALILHAWLGCTTAALSQDDVERCSAIAADQARLDCLRALLQKSSSGTITAESGDVADLWPLIRTPRPNGAADAVAIMRTAETTQSDPDLAGLMIRCQEKARLEVLLALVRPLPPRSKRNVTVNLGPSESVLHGEALPIGTALLLPIDATTFTTGPWRDLNQLSVRISDPEGDIRGVISLGGIRPAVAKLAASCPSG